MTRSTAETIHGFLAEIRSGEAPERADIYLAPEVLAHQVVAGMQETLERTPSNYTEHVHEMIDMFGHFELTIEELLVNGDKAYVRWVQHGHHIGVIDGFEPTGHPLETIGSAVYRVVDGFIVEYWIQQESVGLRAQLEALAGA